MCAKAVWPTHAPGLTASPAGTVEPFQVIGPWPLPTLNTALVGKKLERQPNVLYNAGLYYDDGMIDAAFFTNYTGDNYTAANNAIQLKGWNVANLDVGVKVPFGASTVRLGVNVFNVFNSQATTEGSPRQDVNQTVGGAYFVGRPVLPRRISAKATVSF